MLSFYAARRAARRPRSLAFNLDAGSGTEGAIESPSVSPVVGVSTGGLLAQVAGVAVQQVGQLLSFTGSALDLVTTLLTVSVVPGPSVDENGVGAGGQAAGVQPSTVAAVAQGYGVARHEGDPGGDVPAEKAGDPEGPPLEPESSSCRRGSVWRSGWTGRGGRCGTSSSGRRGRPRSSRSGSRPSPTRRARHRASPGIPAQRFRAARPPGCRPFRKFLPLRRGEVQAGVERPRSSMLPWRTWPLDLRWVESTS